MQFKAFFLFLLLFGFGQINAQDVIDKVSDETCECLNKRLTGDNLTSSQIEMVLGLCMLEVGGNNSEELEKETGIPMDGVESMEKLGEVIGERMATRCDKFMELLFILMGDENSQTSEALDEMMDEMDDSSSANVKGSVSEVSGDNLLTIKVKNGGKTETFVCIGEFSGVGVVKLGNDLVGKDVFIEYKAREMYSPKMKTMTEVKEIKKIELQ